MKAEHGYKIVSHAGFAGCWFSDCYAQRCVDCESFAPVFSGWMNIMKRFWGGLFFLATLANAYSEESLSASLPIISLLVRVHLVQSETIPEMHTTLVEEDIRRIFVKVNSVWAQAGIQFEIESIGQTQAVLPMVEARGKPEFAQVKASLPKERLGQTALDICYVKKVVPNGFFYEELIVVKDTASLKEVNGGLDEPLPRVTSHEIGHALGLQHRQDMTNLMASGTTGFSLNEAEVALARGKAKERLDRKHSLQSEFKTPR